MFDRIEADAAIRMLVLTGTGRAFSTGYDLNSVAERAASEREEQSAGWAFEVVVNRAVVKQVGDTESRGRIDLWCKGEFQANI
jgi:enoyl-CoA hydratase/carnithine racemase